MPTIVDNPGNDVWTTVPWGRTTLCSTTGQPQSASAVIPSHIASSVQAGDHRGRSVDSQTVSDLGERQFVHNPQHLLLLPSYQTKEQQELRTREHRR